MSGCECVTPVTQLAQKPPVTNRGLFPEHMTISGNRHLYLPSSIPLHGFFQASQTSAECLRVRHDSREGRIAAAGSLQRAGLRGGLRVE